MEAAGSKSTLLAVVGSTTSGKSALAMRLAERLNGEIVCADSRTIYRDMNIGTAKPTPEDQARVPHHLLDIVNPDEKFTAADFQQQARQALQGIRKRGKLPIMAGGTGLYIDSILFAYEFGAQYDVALKSELAQLDHAALRARAEAMGLQVPPQIWANPRHLAGFIARGGAAARASTMLPGAAAIGLCPSREALQRRVIERTEHMLTQGLAQEVQLLAEQYGWLAPGMNGIGYAEFKDYFNGSKSLAEVRKDIIKNTLAYAKRQATWFKRNQFIQWYSTPDEAYEAWVQS